MLTTANLHRDLRNLAALILIATLALFSRSSVAEPIKYNLDPDHLTVAFLIDHIGYAKTLGVFHEVFGSFTFDEQAETLSNVEVVVETASVDTFHDRRDHHVKSKDFLDVDTYPQMTFSNVRATRLEADAGRLVGDLTLLGVTRSIELSVTRNKSAPYPFGKNPPNTLGLSLRGEIRRSDFGMNYGVENGLVGDIVDLIIEAEAKAAP